MATAFGGVNVAVGAPLGDYQSIAVSLLFPLHENDKERVLGEYQIGAEAKPIIKSDSIFLAFVRIVFMVGLIVNPLQTSNLVNDHHEFSR